MTKKWTSRLIVESGNPAVRIDVVDSNFQICARGYNRIDETLPTGIYKVRYQAGDAVVEKLVKMQPDDTVRLSTPPKLEFASAAPMEQTYTSHEAHQAHASSLSRDAQLKIGQGSELFFFVRDLEPGGSSHPMHGLTLHDLDGNQIVDLEKESQRSMVKTEAQWAGCTIAVDPGSYRLRLALERGPTIETIVVACPGWQSELFLLRRNSKEKPNRFEPLDLSTTTQLMARPEKGFDPYLSSTKRLNISQASEDVRLAELARLAVANQWRGFHTKDLNALLQGKFCNPMLGILGLHLLLMRPEPDLRSAARIQTRLHESILNGYPHPDVEALGIEIARRSGKAIPAQPIKSPPMLRSSWSFLLKATTQELYLIPAGSFCAKLSDHIWGKGAWLTWVVPTSEPGSWIGELQKLIKRPLLNVSPPADTSSHSPLEGAGTKEVFESVRNAMLNFLPSLEVLIQDYDDVAKLAKRARLDDSETTLLYFVHLTLQIMPTKSGPITSNLLSLESLVQSLGIPADRIQITMTRLLEKLRPFVKPRR